MPHINRKLYVLVILCLGAFLALGAGTEGAISFTDVSGHWAEAQIAEAVEQGVVHGYPDHTFRPDAAVTERDFGTMLSNAGYELNFEATDAPTRRDDAARFIAQALGLETRAAALTAADVRELLSRFRDGNQVSQVDRRYVALAIDLGIFKGIPRSTYYAGVQIFDYDPSGVVTRAQAATLVSRLLNNPIEQNHYIGSQACLGCHTDKYTGWEDTLHHTMTQQALAPGAVVADLNTLPDAEQWLPLYQQARFTLGSAWKQEFVLRQYDGLHYVLPFAWNVESQQWMPTATDTWSATGNSWEANCASCHTTGFQADTGRYAELGIGCEACHGPGYLHATSGGRRSLIVRDLGVTACATCHSQSDGGIQSSAASAAGTYNEYSEWSQSAHASANHIKDLSYASDSCMECHSADFALADGGPTPDRKDVTTSINCNVCHTMHSTDAGEHQLRLPKGELCQSCHTGELEGSTFAAGSEVHHAMKEFNEGVGAIGVDATPGLHAKNGVDCIDCHMSPTGAIAGEYDAANHTFDVITPKLAAETGSPDSCTSCHTHENASPEVRQQYIDFWQNSTRTALDEARGLLDKLDAALAAGKGNAQAKALRAEAFTNISFVESDGSMGVHNYDYAMKILSVTKQKLQTALTLAK